MNHSPSDHIVRKFNGYRCRPAEPARATWRLRTEKLIDGAWQTIATFPTVPPALRSDQRDRLKRHARAFGGIVRLLQGDTLLALWDEGELVEDWREVAA